MRRLPLPNPATVAECLRGSLFEQHLCALAEKILNRRVPLLGYEIPLGDEICWRRDYIHDRETPPVYLRRIPYLDFARAGDHKIIWELNRHQHLVVLAQAAVLTGRKDFTNELFAQLESWLDQNPVGCGINWTSALEVAFRGLSWIWIHHLAGDRMPTPLASRWRRSLYHHGCFLENNLSIYFSPNTHLQGEALALHALGMLFGEARWQQRGTALMHQIMETHVHPDGGHFEHSSYYHLYATDMFLFHAVLDDPGREYLDKLRRMARYLWALAAPGELPFFGDDDGGRLFYPFGNRARFARATLAACSAFLGDTPWHSDPGDLHEIAAWWLGNKSAGPPSDSPVSEFFPDSGIATMVEGGTQLTACVRAFGRGSAGHSHAHSLHFVLRHAGETVLIDPGTYTYVSDPVWRDRFRGTAAHNTVRIDRRDQADPSGPFRWANLPEIEMVDWKPQPWRLHARCRYRGLCHERRIIVQHGAVWIVDDVSGAGTHRMEQFWHVEALLDRNPIRLPGGVRLIVPETQTVEIEQGWRSPVPGVKEPHPVLRISVETELPCRMAAVFDFRNDDTILRVEQDRLSLGDREIRL